MNRPTISTLSMAACLFAAALASGAASAQEQAQERAQDYGLEHGVAHGVPYVNGGIGKEQAERIEHRDRPYNLRLVFSEGRKNDYAADVRLKITDTHGNTVFDLADAGPLTDLKLPAGTYRVDARFGAMARGDTVQVKEGQPVALYLHFPHDAPQS
jgi:hypothetical protein